MQGGKVYLSFFITLLTAADIYTNTQVGRNKLGTVNYKEKKLENLISDQSKQLVLKELLRIDKLLFVIQLIYNFPSQNL